MNWEDRIQAAIVRFVRTTVPDSIIFHVPNGGLRTKREAARLKWIGVLAGVPDLVMVSPRGVHFIEVKSADGTLDPEQEEFLSRASSLGFDTAVVLSIDDVRDALKAWGVPTREAAA